MLTFNVWISLTGTALDKSKLMLPQLQKLNDACIMLSSNNMEITDLQFSFILLKALPESYSIIATAVLTGGAPSLLTPLIMQEWILNEESQWASSTALLNKVAPVKTRFNKKDIKCYYC